jgi:lipid-binding SYLF domain-containing protein
MFIKRIEFKVVMVFLALLAMMLSGSGIAMASEASTIKREALAAYETLLETTPAAAALAEGAEGVLIFPSIVKGGFMIGGQYGEGALIKNGKVKAYYTSTAVSYGFQAGVQKFGYALIFMTQKDLDYLDSSSGWEVGVGPSLVVVDEGMAKSITTTTTKEGVYAFFFSQKGLMAGLGLQGTKITRIYPL